VFAHRRLAFAEGVDSVIIGIRCTFLNDDDHTSASPLALVGTAGNP
jgi:hypothetical protein